VQLLRFALFPLVLLLAFVLASANLEGPASGYTGAPGEEACSASGCHAASSGIPGRIYLRPATNTARDTADFKLSIDDYTDPFAAARRFGFQLTVLDSMGLPYGEILVTDSIRTRRTTGPTGRVYLSHTATGALRDPSGRQNWTFQWIRPADAPNGQPAYLHVAALLADSDGTAAGDSAITAMQKETFCLIQLDGDLDNSGRISSADIIVLLKYIFKGNLEPKPCAGAGDVNCDAKVTASDLIVLINFVFKSGPPLCDVCALVHDGTWDSCW